MRYLHTMLRVRDLNAALDFYCNKLGLQEVRRRDDEKGRYTLDEFADVMEAYWRFLASLPEPAGAVRQYWPDLPRAEAEVKLWEQVWKRGHPYRGRLF